MPSSPPPYVSVVVPVRDGESTLERALVALEASELSRDLWELIVVDDGSVDRTAAIAGVHADRLVSLEGGPRGPAFARNRGAEVARGEIVVFVDADVLVHPDALGRMREVLADSPETVAVFGAYDTAPEAPGFVSQYRNLLHHYVHSSRPGDADTFWAGLGAVRRSGFRLVGGFDEERYLRPQIEDIELGYRLRDRGFRIVLDPEIQGTHLKRWTLGDGVRCDVFDRGVPWMRLLLEQRSVGAGTLNVELRERVLTLSALASLVSIPVGLVAASGLWLSFGVACLVVVLAGNAALLGWFTHVRGPAFAAAVVPLRLLYYVLNGVSIGLALLSRRVHRTEGRRDLSSPKEGRTRSPGRSDVSTGSGAT